MSTYIITQEDYDNYTCNTYVNKVELIWADLVANLPSEQLKTEARYKGYALEPQTSSKDDSALKTFLMTVPDGSLELLNHLKKLYNKVSFIRK